MRYIKKTISGLSSAWQGIDHNQLIYMEKSFSPAVCGFIEEKLDFLESSFKPYGLEFVYLPKVAEPINGQEYLNYIVPTGKRTHGFATSDVYDMLFPEVEDMPDSPFIMRCTWKGRLAVLEMWILDEQSPADELASVVQKISYRNADSYSSGTGCCSIEIEEPEESEFMYCAALPEDEDGGISFRREREESKRREKESCKDNSFFEKIYGRLKGGIMECIAPDDSCYEADFEKEEATETLPITVQWETTVNSLGADFLFNEVMASDQYKEATNKIYEAIEQLHKLGIGTLVIKSIARKDGSLSRICIDDNYNITLPEYNNMTIDMAPMTKAVFLLFLRHEEGIVFKDLPDYRKELMVLYWDMVESDDEASVRSKVERVTNPFCNAINEHCSRIKAAFALKFDDTLASSYYINGRRGEAKRISLPRELVEWELL